MTTSPDGHNRPVAPLGEVAVRYARHGWPVIPLTTPGSSGCSCSERSCTSPGKHPRIRQGLLNASTDPQQVRRWWGRWPEANIGVRTGAPSGLLVVDVDLPEGPANLAELEQDHDPLAATCEQRTGSGGRQLLFAHPGEPVRNRTGLVPGIDVRADGGYIVVPPSRHASGHRYRWTARVRPAPAPDWLLSLVARRDRTPPPAGRRPAVGSAANVEGRAGRYAQAALERELAQLSTAVDGNRNVALNRAAFSLGQLVAGGLLGHDEVVTELERVAAEVARKPASHPFTPTEITRTIASGLSAGADSPREVPTPRTRAGSRSRAPVRRRVRRR